MKPLTAMCLCATLCLAATPGRAGVIRGVVRVRGSLPASPVSTSRVPSALLRQASDGPVAVVYLDSIPAKVEKKLAKDVYPVRIGQGYGQFHPSVATVTVGDTVIFENHDRVYHNAFSVSPTHRFDIGKYAPRQNRRVVFNRPGTVTVFCDIDPGESGTIVVAPNHACTLADRDGFFELPRLPAGRYRLHVIRPAKPPIVRDVEIPKHGDVALDLRM